jgi:ParB/RepB/Spo0J family partition protein
MSFKKIMQKKGAEMVAGVAKEIAQNLFHNPKAISEPITSQILKAIKNSGKVTTSVPIDKIIIDENVRKQFSEQSIQELGESLKDVGLLHNIILHIVERNGDYYFHCISGMRRLLAAKFIGWEKIEADITLEQSPIESLYIGAIANLHEQVFWLDNALLYSKLFNHGHTDEQIAHRVKANVRTIGWFRRLALLSPSCQSLAYANPHLFNSRWAQKLSMHGELPDSKFLESQMTEMIEKKKTWHTFDKKEDDKTESIRCVKEIVTNFSIEQSKDTIAFLSALVKSGYLTKTMLKKIQSEFFKDVLLEPQKPVDSLQTRAN